MAGESTARPVQLHVIHDLGGGSQKWLADYCKADRERTNLVLRPYAHDVSMATGIALYAEATSDTPLRIWPFTKKIYATVTEHPEYRAALKEIIAAHRVGAILVSSLIGHSLDALATGLPTVVVMHDYFPWCPAINLYYDGVCTHCDGQRVAQCHAANEKYNPFVDFTPAERMAVRELFVELIRRPGVVVATPSRSVESNLKRLDRRFEGVRFATIPHGYADPLPHVDMGEFADQERLRVLVMGQMSAAKGRGLFEAALPRLAPFADVYMLGCRELGELWKFEKHVTVIGDYRIDELPGHIAAIRPHVGLLMSIVSETFGYALSELFMMGVPVVASRVGAFAERVRHGENGWLFDPDVASMVNALRTAAASPDVLARMRANLATFRHRTAEEMVSQYHKITPVQAPADGAPAGPAPAAAVSSPAPTPEAVQAATLAGMWKRIKSLELELTAVAEARHRAEIGRLADADGRRKLEERMQKFARELADREARLVQHEMRIEDSTNQIKLLHGTIQEIYGSSSWRLSKPVRMVGGARKAVRPFTKLAGQLVRDPSSGRARARELVRAWRAEGWAGVREAVEAAEAKERNADDWFEYRANVERALKPAIVPRVGGLPRHPLISIVVPIYNPDPDMFRQMLLSVRAQLYPYWELCLADDGSTVPYVRQFMEEFAGTDKRIKLSHSTENRGVSHASNRALALATGEFVVLADHDDVLEEQALFRFAEAIVEDEPDFAYSDEVLVTHDRDTVIRYVYRPSFSPELLRSHPYIVHLVGMRADLLRSLGGWDEKLSISQDYDLILRATEKAHRVVHIPEILYRWRVHGSSAGLAKQHQVMEVSKTVLTRHLERIGKKGHVEDGPGFNYFDTRYDLEPGLKVAIVIPTKNHGDLLRQCVESIHKTAKGAAYDIVVVDHESDDPSTVAYLRSLVGQAQVLRYEGEFNFAAINNYAISQLDGSHTHYLLCNNDIEAYEEGWLERMLELGQQADVGMVGAKLFYPDRKTIQHAGVCIGMFGAAEHYGKALRYPEESPEGFAEALMLTHEVAAVTAACVLIRKDAYAAVHGFDESIAVGFGDVDLCLRIGQAGYRILFCPRARLVHHESFTRGVSRTDPHPTDSAIYRIKWREYMKAGDPFYSPGLSLTSTKWELRRPLPVNVDLRRRIATIDPATGRTRVTTSVGKLD